MKSPFLFLEGATEKTVAKVHSIILSSDPAQQKHADIQDNIPQELKPEYDDWTRKKRHDPPIEVLRELKPNLTCLLYRNLANKKWDEIWSIFGYLTPATRQIAEQWFTIITNDDRLTEDALQNAKETLIQLRERGCIRDYEFKHSVSESVEHYNYIENEATVTSSTVTTRQSDMQLYTNNPPGYAPKIQADISSIDGNHEQRQSTYGYDYGRRGSNQESRWVYDKETHQYRNDTKRMSETREEDHTIQPVEKEIRYGCTTGELSMKLDIDRSTLADTAAKLPSSNRRTSATTHNEQNVNKEETAQKKELATTLENAEKYLCFTHRVSICQEKDRNQELSCCEQKLNLMNLQLDSNIYEKINANLKKKDEEEKEKQKQKGASDFIPLMEESKQCLMQFYLKREKYDAIAKEVAKASKACQQAFREFMKQKDLKIPAMVH